MNATGDGTGGESIYGGTFAGEEKNACSSVQWEWNEYVFISETIIDAYFLF